MVIRIDCRDLKDYTDEQIRAVITAYCCANEVEVDTANWDSLIFDIFTHYYCGSIKTLEEFDIYMSELLI